MKEEAGESNAGGAAAGASGGKRTGAAAEKACLYSRTTCHSIRGSGECALTRFAEVCTSWAGLRPSSSSVGGADRGVLSVVVDAVDIGFDQVVENPGLQRVVRVMPWQNISPVQPVACTIVRGFTP